MDHHKCLQANTASELQQGGLATRTQFDAIKRVMREPDTAKAACADLAPFVEEARVITLNKQQ